VKGILSIAVLMAMCACGDASGAKPEFDAAAAMQRIKTQLDFGPRIPGTPAHTRTGDWIVGELRPLADTVLVQQWTHVTVSGDSLPMRNILARFRPELDQRVLYLTHWDTRPISDAAFSPGDRSLPVPGANDGASGVALQIGVAAVLARTPPSVGVDLLFVDGEDFGDFGRDEDVLIGSRYFAEHLPSPDYQPLFGVLWDMIGDRDLQMFQEANSVEHAPEVVSRVWQTAADLGYSRYFVPRGGQFITDDHIPLQNVGLRVIDVIDIDYVAHHTPDDTMDKVSEQSMKIVGDVAVALIRGLGGG
jgi:hypothetical protein